MVRALFNDLGEGMYNLGFWALNLWVYGHTRHVAMLIFMKSIRSCYWTTFLVDNGCSRLRVIRSFGSPPNTNSGSAHIPRRLPCVRCDTRIQKRRPRRVFSSLSTLLRTTAKFFFVATDCKLKQIELLTRWAYLTRPIDVELAKKRKNEWDRGHRLRSSFSCVACFCVYVQHPTYNGRKWKKRE